MIHAGQFRERVVRPVLVHLGLHSVAAENLMLGTAVQESRLTYLSQLGGGPARGLYQVEPATHADVWRNFLDFRPELAAKVRALAASAPAGDDQLVTNLAYGCAIARLVYRRVPEPLPEPDDIEGLAGYWKRFYNTRLGAGTVAEWMFNYRENVEG